MAARGKQSAASLAIVSTTGIDQRLAPPATLTPAQKAEWVSIINSRPADWFGEENAASLVQYCRHKVQADLIAAKLESFNPDWLDDEDGLKRYDKLSAMLERETRTINALMRSMRLTQQSTIRADKVIPQESSKGKKPWQKD